MKSIVSFQTEEDYIPYPSVHEVNRLLQNKMLPSISKWDSTARIIFLHSCQVLGRTSPFPLILLPQFGGYWIEGTNHELRNGTDPEQLLSPTSRFKLECNTTAKIYRKHFLGKVRTGVQHP